MKKVFKLEERLSNFKKYRFKDDFKYRNIGDIRNLFNGVALNEIDENYYRPIRTKSAFNGNYIKYESKGDYLDMIRPYLSDIINDDKTPTNLSVHSSNEVIDYETQYGEWKIQLTMSINFISSEDSDETRNMHTKNDNIEIMMGSEKDDIINEIFESLLQKYQEGLEESMGGSEFIFDSVDLSYYNLKEIILNRKGSSYKDSPKWLKNKKATINPKNNDNNCFHYALTVALNYQSIEKEPQIISKIKPFINQYNWIESDFPSEQKDWKKFELNSKSIAFNILFVPYNTEKIRLAYKSNHNFKRENQVVLLMITDGKKWHYLAVKSLSVLLRGITSNHDGDFYCLNCFHSYRTEKQHERVCNDHNFCYVEMPNEYNKILKYNHGEKSLKTPAIIYADFK